MTASPSNLIDFQIYKALDELTKQFKVSPGYMSATIKYSPTHEGYDAELKIFRSSGVPVSDSKHYSKLLSELQATFGNDVKTLDGGSHTSGPSITIETTPGKMLAKLAALSQQTQGWANSLS